MNSTPKHLPEAGERLDAEARRQRIAELAYRKAEQRGFHGDRDLDDWLEAEREVDAIGGADAQQATPAAGGAGAARAAIVAAVGTAQPPGEAASAVAAATTATARQRAAPRPAPSAPKPARATGKTAQTAPPKTSPVPDNDAASGQAPRRTAGRRSPDRTPGPVR